MTPFAIRRATPDDLDAIMDIERGPDYARRVGRSPRAEHEAMLAGPRHVYFVGGREEVEAFAILRDLDDPHGNVYLKRIAARPSRGAGGALLTRLIDWLFAETPAHRFYLDCFDDNLRAQEFYAKHGFTRDGVLREAYFDGAARRDLILMALTRTQGLRRGAPAG